METRVVSLDQVISDGGAANISQHYQQHFQQHYAATSSTDGAIPIPVLSSSPVKYSYGGDNEMLYETHCQENQTPTTSFESHSQLFQSNTNANELPGICAISSGRCGGSGASSSSYQHLESNTSNSKKTVQTTTTTTTTQQPSAYILADDTATGLTGEPIFLPPPPFAFQSIEAVPVTHVQTNNNKKNKTDGNTSYIDNNKSNYVEPYSIHVEHIPETNSLSFNWNNMDTYLHIFLTFYFGHFAAMLFFDGILRSIASLYMLQHTNLSPLIYIIHIIFSICYLAFTIWFMTVLWRWWRNKSLEPINALPYLDYAQQKPNRLRDRQSTANRYVFIAACILILGFFIYLIIGLVDLNFKRENEALINFRTYSNKNVTSSLFTGDWIVFIFRLVFSIVGILATLMLSRQFLYKYFCPAKQIKINKERPTTVYQVRN